MSLIRGCELEGGEVPAGQMYPFSISVVGASYGGRPVQRILVTAEKQRRIWGRRPDFFRTTRFTPIACNAESL